MKYESFTDMPASMGLIIVAVIGLLFLLASIFNASIAMSVISGIFFLITATMTFTSYSQSSQINADNREVATSNLMQKYDIKDALWDATDTTAYYKDAMNVDKNLVIMTQDGQKYIFKYGVDKESYEPTLSDMPKLGGSTTSEAVTAESLLQKQVAKK